MGSERIEYFARVNFESIRVSRNNLGSALDTFGYADFDLVARRQKNKGWQQRVAPKRKRNTVRAWHMHTEYIIQCVPLYALPMIL